MTVAFLKVFCNAGSALSKRMSACLKQKRIAASDWQLPGLHALAAPGLFYGMAPATVLIVK